MTRGNRFAPRNQVEDLARRQHQRQEVTQPAGFGTTIGRPGRQGVEAIQEYLTTTWLDDPVTYTTENLFGTSTGRTRAIRDNFLDLWNATSTDLELRQTRPIQEEVAWDTTGLNDLRTGLVGADRPHTPRQPRPVPRGELSEEEHLNRLDARKKWSNFRKGERSREKSKTFSKVLLGAIVMERNYSGKVFKYKVSKEAGVGVWSVNDFSVAEIDLKSLKISSITLPVVPAEETVMPYSNLHNKVRFLWRHLGLEAIRYKNKTIVHTGLNGTVLSPGDKWVIKEAYSKSFIENSNLLKIQVPLFENLPDGTKGTKSITWYFGEGETRKICYGVFVRPDGSVYNLNNPPEDTGGPAGESNAVS